jgi:heterodisulfide reductase subunit D
MSQLGSVREIRDVNDPASLEVLYWIGCATAADERVASVARSMVRILNRAGVRFAILGAEERCTGDPARRTGNELQFDALARANIETLSTYRIARIVTHCPHCFHTFRNEYPQLGGNFDVVHHADFIRELIEGGRITLPAGSHEKITYHDPCYLSRHNHITESPRRVLDHLGVVRIEMRRSGKNSFCCGAGGGHAFFEERTGGAINQNRANEVVSTGATTVCTACPFCLTMMEDGLRGVQAAASVRVRDLAELVDELLGS